jgi:hypothetical protein
MTMKTYGTTVVASSIDITDEQYKELASRYTKALAESMANTKLAITRTIFKGDFRDVDIPGGKPSWEVEVDFNE